MSLSGAAVRFVGGALLLGLRLALVFIALLVTIGARQGAVGTAQRSGDVLTSSFQTQKQVLDVETGVRGYLLTKEAQSLQPYDAAVARLPGQLASLERLTLSEPARALTIAAAVTDYIVSWATPAVSSGPAGDSPAQQTRGKQLVDALRGRFNAFDAAQHQVVDRPWGEIQRIGFAQAPDAGSYSGAVRTDV